MEVNFVCGTCFSKLEIRDIHNNPDADCLVIVEHCKNCVHLEMPKPCIECGNFGFDEDGFCLACGRGNKA